MALSKPSIAAFFKKHQKSLSFAGAALVFTTYIVKEQLGETWKETVDAVEMAQYMYAIRVDTTHGRLRFDGTDPPWASSSVARGDLNKPAAPPSADQRLQGSVADLEMGNTDMQSRFSTMEILVQKFPDRIESKAEFYKLRNEENAWHDGTLRKRAWWLMFLPSPGTQPTVLKANEAMANVKEEQVQEMGAEGAHLVLAVHDLEDKVTEDAKELKETDERWALAAGRASFVLYAIGWLLGAAGGLFGGNKEFGGAEI